MRLYINILNLFILELHDDQYQHTHNNNFQNYRHIYLFHKLTIHFSQTIQLHHSNSNNVIFHEINQFRTFVSFKSHNIYAITTVCKYSFDMLI